MAARQTQTPKENYDLVLYRLEQIEKKLDTMSKNYVTKEEFETKIDDLEDKIKAMQSRQMLDKIMVTLFTSVIVSLTWYVISNALKKD